MKRTYAAAAGVITVATLSLTACSGGSTGDAAETGGPVTLTLSGWALDTTPEFQLLADAFSEKNPDVTIEVTGYDAADYNTLLTTDLAAGSGPDIITQKEVKYLPTLVEGGQLLDVSDVALSDEIGGASSYQVDGTQYAVPYRQDSWVLFYNKALFAQAGVAEPDGSWTWADYDAAAAQLTDGLAAAGSAAKGTYQHRWQSTVQGFANAQQDGDILSGEYDYMAPYYERVLALQDDGDQVTFNTSTANQLTYQGEFGTQNAAMLPMGTWYVATLIAQQASGDANTFEWGIAPIPQADASTTGTTNIPVTFGDPTGFGINAGIADEKVQAAKDFLAFASSEEAAQLLAGIGITPALLTDGVVETYFSNEGAPQDELSRFAFAEHDTLPENPTSNKAAAIQNILLDMHSAILSGSTPVDAAITDAQNRVANEVGLG
ncbi:ABC transporter substrate-binding protein [Microbacterium enclense]|uniref:ABC transporter substrate-binding protein n=1 Tax=Microbacterium enclense TaxID=993073 RepID=UPI0034283E64